jgi:hypothetical protein
MCGTVVSPSVVQRETIPPPSRIDTTKSVPPFHDRSDETTVWPATQKCRGTTHAVSPPSFLRIVIAPGGKLDFAATKVDIAPNHSYYHFAWKSLM